MSKTLHDELRDICERSTEQPTLGRLEKEFHELERDFDAIGLTQDQILSILKKKYETIDEVKNMDETFWDKLDLGIQDFPDFFTIENGITYTFQFGDDFIKKGCKPRDHRDKQYQRDQWLFDVKLIKADKKSEKNEIGTIYTLALGKRALLSLKSIWFDGLHNDATKKFTMIRTGQGYQTQYEFKVV